MFFVNWARSDASIWLSCGEDGKIQVWPCRQSKRNLIISWILTVLTVGFLRLFFYWKPLWQTLATCDLSTAEEADHMLVRNDSGDYFLHTVRTATWPDGLTLYCPGGDTVDVQSCRYFIHRKLTFVWHPVVNAFHKLFNFDSDVPLTLFSEQRGLSSSEANKRFAIFGSNEIAVDLNSVFVLLVREVFSPFYVFQVFSVCVWYSENYNYYASIIIVVSAISITVNVWQTRRNQRKLRDVMYSIDVATVWRDGAWRQKSTTILVPGDVIYVPDTGEMHCDAILLKGSCIVNESMLTGESVPTTKTPVRPEPGRPDERFDSKDHAKNTLFCGTKILQTKHATGEPVTAVVIRTGFSTTKGRLVRAIMYPKPIEFEFSKDLFKFIGVFCVVALAGFIYTIILMVQRGNTASPIIKRSLDIITIVIPPALPAALTIGIVAAQRRLKKAMIYCISPSAINAAGGVNVVCFDKTGTLTEEGLDLYGIVPTSKIETDEPPVDADGLTANSDLVCAMASCHSLTRLNGQLAGDPMDLILFKHTGWSIEEQRLADKSNLTSARADTATDRMASPDGGDQDEVTVVLSPDGLTQIRMVREYPFTSSSRRMSILARVTENAGSSSRRGFYVYCKGAPETVVELCATESVPKNFFKILKSYATCGYRVIALASRKLDVPEKQMDVNNASRAELETALNFLGFAVFENRIKDQSAPNIKILKKALIRTIMVTGDNLLTAVSVAHECGLLDEHKPLYTVEATLVENEKLSLSLYSEKPVDESVLKRRQSLLQEADLEAHVASTEGRGKKAHHAIEPTYQLAVSGATFGLIASHASHMLPNLVACCDVYARMAPEQKVQLVTNLQELGYVAAMCGDGANDCGALKAAHVGISLSEAEASIASPFTSKVPDISCVTSLIRQGRAALVTSFGIVKYMCCYSLTQFLAVVILYWIGSNLADFQFLYSDLILSTTYAICFGFTDAAHAISPQHPATRILTWTSVTSIFFQISIVLVFQVFAFDFVKVQPWFIPYVFPDDINNYIAYQTTCVFLTASFQQIVLCIVYSESYPYRRPLYTNVLLTASLIITTAATVCLTLAPGPTLIWLFDFKMPPVVKYRALIIVLFMLHMLLAVIVEYCIEYMVPRCKCIVPWPKRHRPRYEEIRSSDVGKNTQWINATVSSEEDAARNGNNAPFYSNPAFTTNEELDT